MDGGVEESLYITPTDPDLTSSSRSPYRSQITVTDPSGDCGAGNSVHLSDFSGREKFVLHERESRAWDIQGQASSYPQVLRICGEWRTIDSPGPLGGLT